MLTVDCVVPYVEEIIEQEAFLDNIDVTVLDLVPAMAFKDAINVEVWLRAEPVYNLTTLACCLHVVQVPGRYVIDDNGVEYIACTIP